MNCPHCLESMTPVSFKGIQVDRCPRCGGLFFDVSELNRLLVMRGAESIDRGILTTRHDVGEAPAIYCPRCLEQGHRKRMITLADADEPDARFDQCPDCGGSFFEAGRFQALQHHTIAEFFRELPAITPEGQRART